MGEGTGDTSYITGELMDTLNHPDTSATDEFSIWTAETGLLPIQYGEYTRVIGQMFSFDAIILAGDLYNK